MGSGDASPGTEPGAAQWRGVWVLAAASALAVSVFAATWGYVPRLGSGKARMEFQSANGSDIRTWIRNRTGLDIPLLRKPDASIEMIGARLIEGEGPTVEVSY